MLLTAPKDFERVAREWAVKYAGAPSANSGGDTEDEAAVIARKNLAM